MPAHLIHDVDAIGISLYDYFRRQHIYPQRTRSRVSARMPDDEFQSHIQMDGKVPVLVIKQVALDQQQRPIEYSISYCRSDLYVLCARSSARAWARSRRRDARPPSLPPHFPAVRHPRAASLTPVLPARRQHGCRPRRWYPPRLPETLAQRRKIAR